VCSLFVQSHPLCGQLDFLSFFGGDVFFILLYELSDQHFSFAQFPSETIGGVGIGSRRPRQHLCRQQVDLFSESPVKFLKPSIVVLQAPPGGPFQSLLPIARLDQFLLCLVYF
jgi:hypothetical protein